MRYASIRKMDISNGPGIRISIFVQGCTFNCKNCFNKETHDFMGGKEFTDKELNLLMELAKSDHIVGLSILGGEPLHVKNRDEVTRIAKTFKDLYPNKSIWLWTGFTFEDVKDLEIMNYLDYVVDGQFIDELKDFRLKYRGSANQRIINVKEAIQ